MRCYYDELGISREASDADIKTAYRKLALRWHPDKNPDCIEEAKEQFQLIQQAYDVLSDSHERAWYDNHREQILRGKNSEYEDKCLDLFQYFTVSCFKGYGDDEHGFYKVYSQVFAKIASEDAEFTEDEKEIIPTFGYSGSSYEEFVGPFYAYWQSYCTKKTYSWLCPYDLQEIKDRRVLREIEKDLKKIVQKAKKERNEEVRNLVSFVRKRDKRVQNYKKLLEDRAAINRLKQEQNRLDQIRKRKREVEEMQKLNNSHAFNDCYEEQLKQLEQQYEDESNYEEEVEKDIDANLNDATEALNLDEEEYDYINQIYCVACNKTFKNEKALANHELSKKHRDNIQRLQEEMEQENDEIFQNEKISEEKISESEMYIGVGKVQVEDSAESEEEVKEVKKERKEKKTKKPNKSYSHINTEDCDQNHSELNGISHETEASRESEDVDWDCSNKRSSGKKSKNKQSKNKPAEVKTKVPQETPDQRASPVDTSPISDVIIDTAHTCVTCRANFESKNKLFAHLKKVNHGVYIPKTKASKTIPLETSKKLKSKRK